ncbi:MAG TPA: hypothetical protein VHB27_04150 [Rhodopila sp.]|uniref:hypothetical protein n=1 Tax=Rhodopila sp. TaxID=2480087 RepID=UPI002C4BA95E|nr:hypothetical protein [Rhodopila sp.]HVY14395.1 hypothetical protein [Rhodopila sp.]
MLLFAGLTLYRLAAGASDPAAMGQTSEIAEVSDQDLDTALKTLGGSGEFRSQFRKQKKRCPTPLAWVSVWTSAGQPAVTLRVVSANYYSPVFKVTDKPVRIAIPYPAPYDTGHGSLMVMHAGEVSIGLHPPWHVLATAAPQRHDVTWTPVAGCDARNG